MSKVSNLTITTLPNNQLNIVPANPKDYELSDKISLILDSFKSRIAQVASPGSSPQSITTSAPRALIEQLSELLQQVSGLNFQETERLMVTLTSMLQDIGDFISLTRNFWEQIGRVHEELANAERQINIKSSVARAAALPISCDYQTIMSPGMMNRIYNTPTVEYIDTTFANNNELMIRPPLIPSDVIESVERFNPQTIGLDSTIPPTNIVSVDPSDGGSSVQLVKVNEFSESYEMLTRGLSTFNTKTLMTPLNKHYEIVSNTRSVSCDIVDTVRMIVPTSETATSITDVNQLAITSVRVNQRITVDITPLDLTKSLLDQDWHLRVASGTYVSTQDNAFTFGASTYAGSVGLAIETVANQTANAAVVFSGVSTGKVYTYTQARALGIALRGLWNKVLNIKMQSHEKVDLVSTILSSGLSVAGSLTGILGCVTATYVLGALRNGPSSLRPTADMLNTSPTNLTGLIRRHMLSIIPNLLRAGFENLQGQTISIEDHTRILSDVQRTIVLAYTTPTIDANVLNTTYRQTRSAINRWV